MVLKWFKGSGNKKYKVEKWNRGTKIKTIQFGDKRYQQFKDKTPLKLYSNKDHNDPKRKKAYHARHNLNYETFSPGAFSKKYLW